MRASRLKTLSLALPLAMLCGQAFAVPLLQHRAVYDLRLDSASPKSGISSISGRMVYEFRGTACEGYTTRFRYVTRSAARETSQLTDQQTTTFEDGDAKTFSFSTKSYTDQTLDKELRGEASRDGGTLKVQIDKPATNRLELDAAQFPTQHLVDLIDRVGKGETFYETTIFDGSEDADKVMTTTVVVGKKEALKAADPEAKPLAVLPAQSFWPVDIAYYSEADEGGEQLPEYRISFKLYENGLTRDLVMDYGEFVVKGTLVDLAVFPADAKPCDKPD
ncbi:MAG: cell envelope integrity EipB family protein [Rhizobiaceae bacterium]